MSGRYTTPDFGAAGLITIDTQRDVLDGGPLEIAGTSTALEPMRELVRAFRVAGRPIVHIVRIYRPDGGNVDLCRRAATAPANSARTFSGGPSLSSFLSYGNFRLERFASPRPVRTRSPFTTPFASSMPLDATVVRTR